MSRISSEDSEPQSESETSVVDAKRKRRKLELKKSHKYICQSGFVCLSLCEIL